MSLSFKATPLPGVERSVPPKALDPHYAWAAASAFARYGGKSPELFLLAFEMGITGSKQEAALIEQCNAVFTQPDAFLHPIWWNAASVYGTALVTQNGLKRVEQAAAAGLVDRFEVALMPASERPVVAPNPVAFAKKVVSPHQCRQPVLYGVLDNGCPIASSRLRIAGRSRVLNFWDQDGFFHVPDSGAPQKWKFGSSCSSDEIDAYCAGRPPSDDWALYQEAGLPELARDASHGAHVLGCLFGAHANSSLLWDKVRDRAPERVKPRVSNGPDLVFVQLPSAYVQGMPRGALAPYRLAGLRYVLDCAGSETTTVVVPVASENYDGSHDGQSLFDQATDAMVAYAKQQKQKDLVLVVSAGNSLRTNTHERVDLGVAASHPFRVRVLPGVERQTFVELWAPHALDALEFALQEPGDPAAPVFHSGDGAWIAWDGATPFAGIVSLRQPSSFGGDQRCIMFVIPPTLVSQGTGGVPGDWSITVRAPANASGDVCAFIARMTPGIGGRRRGYQSTFPRRFSSDWDFGAGKPAGPGRPFDEYSLSGLATADKIIAVGGYRLRRKERALYSAGGPGRKPSRQGAFLIDAAAPSDQGSALPGILAWGNRSAGFVRLAGTSVAAPLAARTVQAGAARPTLPTTPGGGRKDPQVPVKNIL